MPKLHLIMRKKKPDTRDSQDQEGQGRNKELSKTEGNQGDTTTKDNVGSWTRS